MRKALKNFLSKRFREIEARHRFRDIERDTAVFDKLGLILIVLFGVAASTWSIYQSVTPPNDVAKLIESSPSAYLKFENAKLAFSETNNPEHLAGVTKHEIRLPFRNAARLSGYIKNGIWYEFEIAIPEDKFSLADTAILIPLVWGNSKVYVDGKLYGYGENYRPLIGIDKKNVRIQIRADLSKSAVDTPILATYPVVAGANADLRRIVSTIEEQATALKISQYPFLAALAFIGAFYLAYRRRPELFVFLGFLAASFSYSVLSSKNDSNILVFSTRDQQQAALLLSDFLLNSFLLIFSRLFFREPFRTAVSNILMPLFSILVICAAATFTATQLGAGPTSFRQLGHIVFCGLFFIAQFMFLFPETLHVLQHSKAPKLRKVTAATVSAAILAVYLLNIFDYYGLLSSVTTQYRNSILIYLVLSMFVAFEAARSEGHKRRLAKLISDEAKVGIELDRNEIYSGGFVILVDAIGFTADRGAFDDAEKIRRFSKEIFSPVAESIQRLNAKNFSLLNSTGDGLYFSLRGSASYENFALALSVGLEIIRCSKENSLPLRVAFGYGNYTVFLFQSGAFQKELVIGGVLNDLNRVIGGDSLRILVSKELEHFLRDLPVEQVIDKQGHSHQFCQISEPEYFKTNKKAA